MGDEEPPLVPAEFAASLKYRLDRLFDSLGGAALGRHFSFRDRPPERHHSDQAAAALFVAFLVFNGIPSALSSDLPTRPSIIDLAKALPSTPMQSLRLIHSSLKSPLNAPE